jgi:biofilm PGA synthesis N-glycosyltransferase PgaC
VHNQVKYVLVTPARNEEQYIGKLLESVINQSCLPLQWVIVSDGSTDGTDAIVNEYAARHDFITLLRRDKGAGRNFGSKVYAVRDGVQALTVAGYDFIGMTDADISFGADFIKQLTGHMLAEPRLGIAGGLVHERDAAGTWMPFSVSAEWSSSGAFHFFRRQCYEAVGGYLPLRRGGIDMVADVMARMHGWNVRTFTDLPLRHYRAMGTAQGGDLAGKFRRGMMEYVNGYHPLFQLARAAAQIRVKPFLLASISRTAGYAWAMLKRERFEVPADVVYYMRNEQLMRLRKSILR